MDVDPMTAHKQVADTNAKAFLKRLKDSIYTQGTSAKRLEQAQKKKTKLAQKKMELYKQSLEKKARLRESYRASIYKEQETQLILVQQEAQLYRQRLSRYAKRIGIGTH